MPLAAACADQIPARALYPMFVHRLARLLYASFGPRLAATALAFSLTLHLHQVGWKDLHLQTAEHAQHTTKPAAAGIATVVGFGRTSCVPLQLRTYGEVRLFARPQTKSPDSVQYT